MYFHAMACSLLWLFTAITTLAMKYFIVYLIRSSLYMQDRIVDAPHINPISSLSIQQSLKSDILFRNSSSLVFKQGDSTLCIVRSRSGDHISQALYVKEDLRVLDHVIMLIFRIETRELVQQNSFFSSSLCWLELFLEYIRYFLSISRREMAKFSIQRQMFGDACNLRDML